MGDPGGRAGQNVGHAFEVSACWVIWDMGFHRCERAHIYWPLMHDSYCS